MQVVAYQLGKRRERQSTYSWHRVLSASHMFKAAHSCTNADTLQYVIHNNNNPHIPALAIHYWHQPLSPFLPNKTQNLTFLSTKQRQLSELIMSTSPGLLSNTLDQDSENSTRKYHTVQGIYMTNQCQSYFILSEYDNPSSIH